MPLNIALVGCGRASQQLHLPALARRRKDFDKIWLVDPSAKAREMARSIVAAEQSATLDDVADDLQFVIVASPNANHFYAARESLLRGAHVLVEKPFAIWPEEARELINVGAQAQRLIAVNQTRRFFPHTQELQKRISSGEFGAIKSIVHNEGQKLSWEYLSGATFQKNARRTGVIMDIGVHVLDFYQYLLNPTWVYRSSIHDGFSGPEGLAELWLQVSNAPVAIRLSRYQKQENLADLYFEGAQVRIDLSKQNAYSVTRESGGKKRKFTSQSRPMDISTLSDSILSNFIAAAIGRERIMCDARSALPVIELLDYIYRCAKHYSAIPGKV
jgi:predicted dehydrogenase